MITPILKGGLGNQLFQISAGLSLANENGGSFGVNYDLPNTRIQGHCPTKYRDNLYQNVPTTSDTPGNTYSEPEFSYKPIPYQENLLIDGYFQSEKHFKNNKEQIKQLFKFNDDTKEKIDKALSSIQTPIIGVHIRRGDYKVYNRVHPPCEKKYYEAAMDLFPKDSTFIMCTDDLSSVQEEFDTSNFIVSNSKDELEDLYLLSQCDNVIICNSTFSWWGAYLGKDKDKIVAPARWFGPDGPPNYQDIFIEDWIKL